MRALWFTNTPCNADEYFNIKLKGTGGWLKALDQSRQDKIDLYIAFHYGYENIKPFKYKNTKYYPIKIYKNKYFKYLNLITKKVLDEEYKEIYLKIINEVRPDIIHIHGTENPYGCIIGETSIPTVCSIQGNLTVIYHKYCSGFEKKYLSTMKKKKLIYLKPFKIQYNQLRRRALIEQKNLLKCKYIFGRTDWDRRIARILAPNSKYFYVNEILRETFYQKEWHPHYRNKLVLFTTSNNTFYKGFETICRALFELNKIGIKCEWRIAGINGDDLIVKVTKKYLKDKFPKNGLTLLGRLNEVELVEKLLDADIFIMPSHIENSSNSLSEAMILGMPCIATFAGGTGSLIRDGKDGILIQDGDPWAMAGAILELADNMKLAVQLGKNARIVALKRHSKEEVCKSYLKSYLHLLS